MDEHKRLQKGSPSRDAFKRWHKDLPSTFYATDIDFALVSKSPAGVIAILDYKRPGECVTFSEVLFFNQMLKAGLSVYIVFGTMIDDSLGPFQVYQYLNGDWRPEPPDVSMQLVSTGLHGGDFSRWEQSLKELRH